MKTLRPKNYLKLGIFLLIIPLLFWQCQEKEDLDTIQLQSQNDSYKIVSLDDLPKLKPVIDNIKNFNRNNSVLNRNTETFMGVDSVLVDEVIQITKQGVSTYTFGIETDFYNSKYIENLHLIEVNEGYIAFIMRYETPDGWEDDDFNKTPEGDLVFDPSNFNGKITKYTLEGEPIWTTEQSTEMYRTMVVVPYQLSKSVPTKTQTTPKLDHIPPDQDVHRYKIHKLLQPVTRCILVEAVT